MDKNYVYVVQDVDLNILATFSTLKKAQELVLKLYYEYHLRNMHFNNQEELEKLSKEFAEDMLTLYNHYCIYDMYWIKKFVVDEVEVCD